MSVAGAVARVAFSTVPRRYDLSFSPPFCRNARAYQGRSLPSPDQVRVRAPPRPADCQPLTGVLIPFGLSPGIEVAIDAGSLWKGSNITDARALRIRELNDPFRTSLAGGKAFFTSGISGRGVAFSIAALAAVRAFADFTVDNDPYGEHDFGSFRVGDDNLLWKIDDDDLSIEYGSKDPADPMQTVRVLTIMLAEEY